MASTVWKGYISFGLISVPIHLFVAAREEHVSFNQVHAVCGTKVKQQLFCPTCERVVERSEIAKGYPIDKGTYVQVTPEELKALEAESSETMEIVQFVKLDEVDPLYYQTSYYTVPEEPGRRAYTLILKGMEHLKLGAIAKITLHQREQIVMIRPYHKGLVLHTLYYPAEVREIAEYGVDEEKISLQKAEVELAEQFMKQLTAKFNPDKFKDEYQDRVLKLVEEKEAGMVTKSEKRPKKKLAPVINLMDALRKSMEQQEEAVGKKAPQRETASAKSSGRRRKAG
ncbi:Ku protein [Pseudacidobacterium ailaaui]|jgi:DNA end-binding protein Ku|uniref:non-homologous end joining protein Ku n=1 Tax=Pseudacidobacterium ailaaui TaxID=1382359 RepID=UPI00047B5BB1|nr:Ku protein [Pseudacidobacterium ailaaui]